MKRLVALTHPCGRTVLSGSTLGGRALTRSQKRRQSQQSEQKSSQIELSDLSVHGFFLLFEVLLSDSRDRAGPSSQKLQGGQNGQKERSQIQLSSFLSHLCPPFLF